MRTMILIAAGTLASMAVNPPAFAQTVEELQCGSFTVMLELDARHYVDHGEPGESPGDQRLTSAHIIDAAGNRIGERHVVGTVMPSVGSDSHVLHVSVHDAFANGSIISQEVGSPPQLTDTSRAISHDNPGAVSGGTGEFAHATGTVTAVTNDDGVREVTYDLICHN